MICTVYKLFPFFYCYQHCFFINQRSLSVAHYRENFIVPAGFTLSALSFVWLSHSTSKRLLVEKTWGCAVRRCPKQRQIVSSGCFERQTTTTCTRYVRGTQRDGLSVRVRMVAKNCSFVLRQS